MLVGVVDVAAEDITTPMRDMVRIIVVRVVVKGMGGQLMNISPSENELRSKL